MIVDRIIQFLVRSPVKALLLGVFFCCVVSFGISKLQIDFGYRTWFTEDNPKLQIFDQFERTFGSDEKAILAVHSPSGIFDDDSLRLIGQLTEDLWKVPDVIRVDSITNYQWVYSEEDEVFVEDFIFPDVVEDEAFLQLRRDLAIKDSTMEGYLINQQGDTSIIYVSLKPQLVKKVDYQKVSQAMYSLIEKYAAQTDHEIRATGMPILTYSFQDSSQADMKRLVPIVLLMMVLFLYLLIRKITGVLLSLLIVFASIFVTMGWGGWLGIKIHVVTAIIPQFMIAIAISIVVHILVTYNQFLRKFDTKEELMFFVIKKNLLPTLLTSVSTAFGFFSFLGAEIPNIMDMGVMTGFGTLSAWILTYLILIPLLALLPFKKAEGEQLNSDQEKILAPSKTGVRFTLFLYRYRKQIISFYIVGVLLSIMMLFKVVVNSNPFEYFDDKYPISLATSLMEEKVGGAMGVEMMIDSGEVDGIKDPLFLQKVELFQSWLEGHGHVTKVVSMLNILKKLNKTLNQDDPQFYRLPDSKESVAQQLFLYTMSLPQGLDINDRVSVDFRKLRMTTMWTLHDSKETLEYIDMFQDYAQRLGLNVVVTGKGPLYQSNNSLVVSSFIRSLGIAIVLISVLLCFGLNSIKMGLFSMLPNMLPIIVGASFLPIFDVPLDIGTVIVASVCLGIAVDDTIHFLSNYRKYRVSGDSADLAIAKVMTHTVPALLTTTVVLVVAFAVFMMATFVPNQNFGRFVALILSFALIIDLSFLPALLLVKTKKLTIDTLRFTASD
ncbi:hypothetical protein DID78_05215 [Candidatus Marinamargulisbacteria bacterium SCGC AG-343-D04]|nr:hypothetical protein DID78_05215 [Candidatus Marinamargulisbacteria bacterium SCGC AG-343-D04]